MKGKKLAIFLPVKGIPSEIWVKRQAESFRKLEPQLISWEKASDVKWSLNAKDVELGIRWNSPKNKITKIADKIGLDITHSKTRSKTAILKAFHERKPDAALFHFGWTAAKLYTYFKENNIPYFVMLHGLDVSIPTLKGAYKINLRRALESAEGIIIVGSHMKNIIKSISQKIDNEKIHLLPCGAPLDTFKENNLCQRQSKQKLKLVTVGRLVQGKGIDLCLVAMSKIRDLDVTLQIIGDGDERANLEQLVLKLKLENNVEFLGLKTSQEIAKHLSESHVLLQPSRQAKNGWVEGFGVSITEAMASGLPVIATKIGGIPDQLRDNVEGFLIECENSQSLVDKIKKYFFDEELRLNHSENAKRRAMSFDSVILSRMLEEKILKSL